MGPQGKSSRHVGTGQQAADSLLEYWDFGMESFLVRGFDQLGDVQDWGELLIPKLRAGIPEKQAASWQVLTGAWSPQPLCPTIPLLTSG